MDISDYRKHIDEIDDQLVRLFAERMATAKSIGEFKRAHGLPVGDARRELEVLGEVEAKTPEELRRYSRQLYMLMFELSRSYQRSLLRCGLIGRKLGHSLTPQLHKEIGSYEYKLYELEEDEVAPFLKKGEFDALNVTVPYKKIAAACMDELSDTARELGSVNTVLRRPDGTLYGDNTDVFGAEELLRHTGFAFSGSKVLVLGSGGASAAVCKALRNLEAQPVVLSRSGADNYDNIERHSDARALVNATPVGMYPDTGRSPLDLTRLPGLELVADLIYNPYRTALLAQAEALGIKAVNGLRMLAAQGLRASELFTGKTLPLSLIDKATDRLAAELNGAPDAAKEVGGRKLMFMVLNGPNINMLGVREPEVYGKRDYRTLLDEIETWAAELGVAVRCYQSNHEGELVDLIQAARGQFDGIVINPAAYTHTSVAILDALKAAGLPAVEVHISDVAAREPFRQISYAGMACIKTYAGLGFEGYRRAMEYLKTYILSAENDAEKRELVEDRRWRGQS